jgi:hypothetical protein
MIKSTIVGSFGRDELFQNLPVGPFGQLKGRTSYIVSSYFDGDVLDCSGVRLTATNVHLHERELTTDCH